MYVSLWLGFYHKRTERAQVYLSAAIKLNNGPAYKSATPLKLPVVPSFGTKI